MKRKLSLILRKLKDPRIPEIVSVTKIKITNDLSFAKVWISIIGDEDVKKKAIDALNKARGFIKKEIGECVYIKHTPDFNFVLDDSTDYAIRIDKIIQEV